MSPVYLYGFVPEGTRPPEGGLLGIADAPVETEPAREFSAVYSRVPDSEFEGAALELNSASVEWMAEQGLRHEQVIAWFVDHAAILPSRLLTLFSSVDRLRETMAEDADRIVETLERFAGLREWDLKVGYDAARMEPHLAEVSAEIQRLDQELETATPGKAFLLRKKRGDVARAESRTAAARLADQMLAELQGFARKAVRIPPAADQAPVVLNAALLIESDREADALERARDVGDRLEALGLSVRYTGPWAPYRFVEEEGV